MRAQNSSQASPPACAMSMREHAPRMHPRSPFLVVVAMVRNECPSFTEWFKHYRAQGVGHFYMIDNNSTDGCDVAAHGNDITWWTWQSRPSKEQPGANQDAAYTYFLPSVRGEWLLLCDIDEFMFGLQRLTSSGAALPT